MLEMIMGGGKVTLNLGDSGPGPTELLGFTKGPGSQIAGYYGKLSYADFGLATTYSYPGLVGAGNLGTGNAWNENTFLKFHCDGKTLFTPMRVSRYGMSWVDLYNLGLVYGVDGPGIRPASIAAVNQLKTVVIGGYQYLVRLFKGSPDSPSSINQTSEGYNADPVSLYLSEWNRLFYNILLPTFAGQNGGKWLPANQLMNPSALNMQYNYGSMTFVQEVLRSNNNNTILRGGRGHSTTDNNSDAASWATVVAYNGSSSDYGWRPCFELIGKVS